RLPAVVVGVPAAAVAVDVDEAGNQPRTVQIDPLSGIRGLARAGRGDGVTVEQQPAVGLLAAFVGEQGGMQQQRHAPSVARTYLPMMVRAPSSSTRSSANHFTAWVRVRLSSSCPMATSSEGVRV